MPLPSRPTRALLAAAALGLTAVLAGCAFPGSSTSPPSALPTVTSAPTMAARAAPVTDAQLAQRLDSAPVPSLCTAPAGTLENGTLPAFAGQAGQRVGLPWIMDARGRLKQDLFAIGTFGPGTDRLIATGLWCTGGTTSTEYLAIYRSAGSALKLVGTYDLGALRQTSAHLLKVTPDAGRLEVLWGTPGTGQAAGDTGVWSRASFVVVGSTITQSGLASSADAPATTQ